MRAHDVPLVEGLLVWALGVQSLIRNVERFLGGLVFKAQRLLHHNSKLESNEEEEVRFLVRI